jgi:hypothetical protein
MERFILENSDAVYEELKEPVGSVFAEIFFQYSSRVFNNIPYRNIFPE